MLRRKTRTSTPFTTLATPDRSHTILNRTATSTEAPWSPSDSEKLYRVSSWGRGYFTVSEKGTVLVHPNASPTSAIDLSELAEGLRTRDIHTPVVIRFSGILKHRMNEFRRVFDDTIAEAEYRGSYSLVYPIKVNQQRHVCEEIREVGAELGFGFEVGSKPELLAALSLTAGANGMPIVCNGFKDEEYLALVTLASKIGRRIVPVVERLRELELLMELGPRFDTEVDIGIRARLDTPGVGRWESSSGEGGKFGLSALELIEALELLRNEGRLSQLRVLHCHVGSQLHDIRAVKRAVTEMGRLYVEMRRLGAELTTIDLGGGLAVDYDGSRSPRDASMNYDLPEYASDIVYRLRDICDEADVPHPNIITESGRAVAAYSSVLLIDVLGAREVPVRVEPKPDPLPLPEAELSQAYHDLKTALDEVGDSDNPTAAYHDAQHAREEAASLFSLGEMGLPERAACEEIFWTVASRTLEHLPLPLPDELADLPDRMADVHFCNFSLFQSLPDVWAIDQVFPIMPVARLGERPTRRAVLADISCDSDGKIDHFIPGTRGKPVLELHHLNGTPTDEPYLLGVFLVGAYQETLGDLHNLFGDTHAVHVTSDPDGSWKIDEVVEGDSVREVLSYVQFEPEDMRRGFRRDIERAISEERITVAEGTRLRRLFEEGLEGYTYME